MDPEYPDPNVAVIPDLYLKLGQVKKTGLQQDVNFPKLSQGNTGIFMFFDRFHYRITNYVPKRSGVI